MANRSAAKSAFTTIPAKPASPRASGCTRCAGKQANRQMKKVKGIGKASAAPDHRDLATELHQRAARDGDGEACRHDDIGHEQGTEFEPREHEPGRARN